MAGKSAALSSGALAAAASTIPLYTATAIRMAEMFLWRAIVVLLALLAVSQVPVGILKTLSLGGGEQTVQCRQDPQSVDYYDACKLLPPG